MRTIIAMFAIAGLTCATSYADPGVPDLAELAVRTNHLSGGSVRYSYVLRNLSMTPLHNFMVGSAMDDSCPELHVLPIGYSERTGRATSIVVERPWHGRVMFQEACDEHFLEFDYHDRFLGIAPGDSLRFSVTVPRADASYEHAAFWVAEELTGQFTGRTRPEARASIRTIKHGN